MKLKINNIEFDIYLEKTKTGIDLCLNSLESRDYILNLTNEGEVMLYADVDKTLRTDGRYIKVRYELVI